jgi:hypothetical protein
LYDNYSDILQIYPNPVSDFLYLKAPINSQVNIYDLLGNEIYNGIINNNIDIIDFQNYPSGIYIVQLKDKNINKTIKIIKN